MNLFHNNYNQLMQDNIDAMANLSAKNWNILKKMFEYMSSYNVSLFELEIIKKDMIGIALEADAEGVDINQKLGMNDKEFCDSLLSDALTKHYGEEILLIIKNIFFWLLTIFALGFWFDGFPSQYGISLSDCFFAIILCNGKEFITTILNKYILYSSSRKQKIIKVAFTIISFILLMLWLFVPGLDNIFIVQGNGYIIFVFLILLTIGSVFINNYYWNCCSEKYNWN